MSGRCGVPDGHPAALDGEPRADRPLGHASRPPAAPPRPLADPRSPYLAATFTFSSMTAVTTTKPRTARWPYVGQGQKHLLIGAGLIVFGSLLPWVMTPFGNLSGVRGAGLWTLCLGVLGVPGAVLRRRVAVFWHALVVAAPAVVLPAWQLARLVELNLQAGTFGAAVPGIGLVLTLGGGAMAGRAAWRLRA